MDYNYIRVEQDKFICTLTLNRPEKRNAFTPTMINEIHHAFLKINTDDKIKLVLIKAEAPTFCAGMDLKVFKNQERDLNNPSITNTDISLGEVFDKLNKPSIALVEGDVIAGGFLIILGCTYVFCKPETRFRLPELALGIFPFQVMASLLKVMPEKKALQLCLQTEYFDAATAIEMGIIDDYLEESKVNELIHSFENVDPIALTEGIKAMRDIQDYKRSEYYDYLKRILEQFKNP